MCFKNQHRRQKEILVLKKNALITSQCREIFESLVSTNAIREDRLLQSRRIRDTALR